MHPIADFVAGALLLALGRKLFWLFVGIAGFYVGIEFVRVLLAEQPQWVMWVVGVGAGLIGAVLALVFQRLGFAMAGFYAGGYVALVVAERFAPGAVGIAAFLVGGAIGAVFAAMVMDWAIIVLSCVLGAALVVARLGLDDRIGLAVFLGLVAVGIVVQSRMLGADLKPRR
jgi:hypothetical protein